MKLDKKLRSVMAVYIIAVILVTLIFALIPFEKRAASWISYGFSVVSLCISFLAYWMAFQRKESLTSKFFGYPIFRVGILYALVQNLLAAVFYVLGEFWAVPYWPALLLSFLLLGTAGIGLIIDDNARDVIEECAVNEVQKTRQLTDFHTRMIEILSLCTDESVKTQLLELEKVIKYSDPVSSEATKAKEEEIDAGLESLKELLSGDDAEAVVQQINALQRMLAVRNKICLANK